MQTFLPYKDFDESAKVLDYKRLGKQRVEAMQILKALYDPNYGWQSHPATKMWRGYPQALQQYLRSMCLEWMRRGYNNSIFVPELVTSFDVPSWLGDNRVHDSHKAMLLKKDLEWYSQFNWDVDCKQGYYWPVE